MRDSKKGDCASLRNFDFNLGIDLFASGNRGFFPGGLDRLFDQGAIPGEIVSNAVGSACITRTVSSAPPGSAGIFEARRLLMSEALGPAGSRDWVDVDLLSVEAGEVETETFFFAVLTLT